MLLLLQPDSDTEPSAPMQPPSNNSERFLAPGITKSGGTLYPNALPQPITVTSVLEPDVTAGTLDSVVTTDGGVSDVDMPFSSIL
ncbi:hypothetical protein DPMN_147550 [Dreissena polymorpha]|uniref:Uncharacterized protein n=1 Tax=Dreissena polymorpha TaxID=45954 RepID=A0A9D4FCE4_DREPO|nr:hypothetical protein DPMN_147550 [Dreissena polymorpha]